MFQPKKTLTKIIYTYVFLASIFLTSAYYGVDFYNQIVDLKQDIKGEEKTLANLQSQNADLKNQYFDKINSLDFESQAIALGLVKVKNPDYISIDQSWAIASVLPL